MGAWHSVTINLSGEGDIYQGYFRTDTSNVIKEFYDFKTNPRSNVLLTPGGEPFVGSDNAWSPGDNNFSSGGTRIESIPYLDASVGPVICYDIFYNGGSNFIDYTTNGSNSSTLGTAGTELTFTFTDLSEGVWIQFNTLWGGVRNDFYFRID